MESGRMNNVRSLLWNLIITSFIVLELLGEGLVNAQISEHEHQHHRYFPNVPHHIDSDHKHHRHHHDHQGHPPHIIFIMADDAGWNDFSFHGSTQIPTPNIDALALNGMILNSYYVSPLCTPTRGALMTGKHPIHLGLQHYVIRGSTSGGLPLSEKLLPAYLKELGYITRLVGKWHLGHSKKEYLPTERGFDSHFGYWLGKQDYYSHIATDGRDGNGDWCWGYDFRNNASLDRTVFGKYGTDVITEEALRLINDHANEQPLFLMVNHMAPHSANFYDPLQAPAENIEKFNETIENENRRIYAAMIDKLDESVGFVVDALARKEMLSNSIIIFASDNGAASEGYDLNYGSNWPLRGVKNTLWEGGTRVAAMIWGPTIQNRVSRDLMHAQDWLPTLYEAAGGNPKKLPGMDGISLWPTLTRGERSPRRTMLYNIDGPYNNSAIRDGPWKLIQGNSPTHDLGQGNFNFWHGDTSIGNVSDLISEIQSSLAGKALLSTGFHLDKSVMSKMQESAQIFCNRQEPVIPCDPSQNHCLFHVEDDPCELWNVAEKEPEQVEAMLKMLAELNETALPPMSRYRHPEGFPRNWGNVWTTWEDELEARLTISPIASSNSSSDENHLSSVLLIMFIVILIAINK